MRKVLLRAALGLGALVLTAQGATAGLRCGPRDDVLKMLHERYEETRRGVGLTGAKQMLEVFASTKGTWTVVVTDPEGRTCLVASGRGWDDLRELLPTDDEAA